MWGAQRMEWAGDLAPGFPLGGLNMAPPVLPRLTTPPPTPQTLEVVQAVGKLSYNQLVEKIITCKHSPDPNLVTEGNTAPTRWPVPVLLPVQPVPGRLPLALPSPHPLFLHAHTRLSWSGLQSH